MSCSAQKEVSKQEVSTRRSIVVERVHVAPTFGQSIWISWPSAPRNDTLATPSALASFFTLTTSLQNVSCFAAVRRCKHLPRDGWDDMCVRPLELQDCKLPRVLASIVSELKNVQINRRFGTVCKMFWVLYRDVICS